MLISPGQLMTCPKRKGNMIGGLLIDFNYTTNWVGPVKIAVYGNTADVLETMNASSPVNQIISGFDELAAGEYNTDSDYNSNLTYWTQPWPGSGAPHWNDSKTASLKAWFKFPAPLSSLTKILIRFRRPDLYGLPPNVLFSDMAGTFYVPVSMPSGLNDYIEIIGNDRTYEWVF